MPQKHVVLQDNKKLDEEPEEVHDKLNIKADDKHKNYYQITVRRTSETSSVWKVSHVSLFALTAVFGFYSCYCYGRAFAAFNFNCMLGGAKVAFFNMSVVDVKGQTRAGGGIIEIVVVENGRQANETDLRPLRDLGLPPIDYQGTRWGSPCDCNFVQFMPLVQMVAAVIWGAFFVSMSRGGTGLSSDPLLNPWRVVGPLLVFCTLLLVPLLVARQYSGSGYSSFCRQFEAVLLSRSGLAGPDADDDGDGGEVVADCDVDIYTTQFSGGVRRPFHTYITTAIIMEKLCLCTWIAQMMVTLVRIVTFSDFQINRITVKNIKREDLVLVHEPDDV